MQISKKSDSVQRTAGLFKFIIRWFEILKKFVEIRFEYFGQQNKIADKNIFSSLFNMSIMAHRHGTSF